MPEKLAIRPAAKQLRPATLDRPDVESGLAVPLGVRRPPTRPRRKYVPDVRLRRPPDPTLRRRHDTLLMELRLAQQVQRSMLPRVLPKLPTLDFGASLRPTLHLAGDFYNVVRLDRDRVGIYLGDVMGHGPAAALLGVFAMQGLRTKSIEGSSYEILPPSVVLAGLSHDLILADFYESPFVTMIYAVLDTEKQSFTYCCGGHPPVMLLRPGEPRRYLDCCSPLLGVFDMPFEQDQIMLQPGDRMALYSDGVESTVWGDYGEGIDGLANVLSIRDGRSAQERVDAAMALARPGEGPADDLTLVMVEVRA